jgi:hypothetical protein
MFVLGPVDLLKVIGVALGSAIACGVALALVLQLAPFIGFFRFFLMAGLGYAVAEAVTKYTRKQGTVVGVIAVVAVVIGVIGGQAVFFLVNGTNLVVAIFTAVAVSLLSLWSLLGLAIAAFVAFRRVR